MFWWSSKALLQGHLAAQKAQEFRENGISLDLWLAVSPWVEKGTGKVGLFTIGLNEMVGREIEMVPRYETVRDAVERALALAGYLLTEDPIVKDGDTIGYSETERLKINYTKDTSGPLMQVMSEETAE